MYNNNYSFNSSHSNSETILSLPSHSRLKRSNESLMNNVKERESKRSRLNSTHNESGVQVSFENGTNPPSKK